MFTDTFLFNSRKTFTSCLSQWKGFSWVSLLWPWLHLPVPKEQVKTQKSGSAPPHCLPGKGQEPSLLTGKCLLNVASHVSKGELEEGEICLNCGSHQGTCQLAPLHLVLSPHLFLPPALPFPLPSPLTANTASRCLTGWTVPGKQVCQEGSCTRLLGAWQCHAAAPQVPTSGGCVSL